MQKKDISFWTVVFAGLFLAVEIIIYIIVWITQNETDGFNYFSNITTMFWSLLVVVVFILLAKEFGWKSRPGQVWLLLALGMAFWWFGDFLWFYVEMIIKSETLFPSVADYAYTIGYPIFYVALILQLNTVKSKIEKREWILLILVNIILLVFSFVFVLYPIIEYPLDGDFTAIQKFYSLVYPVGDIILFFFTSLLVFRFRGGEFAKNWMWVAIGFFFYIATDLFFIYVEWMEYAKSYFIVDILYIIASMLLVIAGIRFRKSLKAI